MDPTDVPATNEPAGDGAAADPGEATFSVGPPRPVTDSRQLPAVSAGDEAGVVSGADLGPDHPDNLPVEPDTDDEDEDLPGEDELDGLVTDVDADDVDDVGFDDADLVEPLEPDGLGDLSPTGGS